MEAEVVLEYDSEKVAQAVADAVSPDNFKTPNGLSVKTARRGKTVVTQIRFEGKFPTFVATVDDLLFCVSTAERALHVARVLET